MAQNITLKTLTPLHIGSGNEYAGNFEFVYFQKEQKIVIIDERKILDIIGIENIDEWVKIIDKKQDLYKFLLQYKSNLTIKDIDKKIINAQNIPNTNQSIKQFMQDGMGKNYIAGSSIKGAIRTAYLVDKMKENPDVSNNENNLFEHYFDKKQKKKVPSKYKGYKDSELNNLFLGEDPNHDIFRLLQISDFYFDENFETECLKNSIANLYKIPYQKDSEYEWREKKGNVSYMECIPANKIAFGKIKDVNFETLQKNILEHYKKLFFTEKNIDNFNIEHLFKIIHQHNLFLLKEELEFLNLKYSSSQEFKSEFNEYINSLENVYEISLKFEDNSCLLRLGAGSGWDFMTGSWAKNATLLKSEKLWNNLKSKMRDKPKINKQYDENLTFPKTRKLINNQPLGFVELSY